MFSLPEAAAGRDEVNLPTDVYLRMVYPSAASSAMDTDRQAKYALHEASREGKSMFTGWRILGLPF